MSEWDAVHRTYEGRAVETMKLAQSAREHLAAMLANEVLAGPQAKVDLGAARWEATTAIQAAQVWALLANAAATRAAGEDGIGP